MTRRFFVFLVLLLFACKAWGIDIRNDSPIESFEVGYFYDAQKSLDIDTIGQQHFTQASNDLHLRPAEGAHWIRLALTNRTPVQTERIVSYSRNILSTVDFYELDAKGVLLAHAAAGMNIPPDERVVTHQWPAYPLVLAPGESKTLFVRFENAMNTLGKFAIRTPKQFVQDAGLQATIFSFYYGVVLTVIIYALLIWGALREKIYLFYVIYLGLFNISMMRISGHTDTYLPPEMMIVPYLATPIAFIFFMLFTRQLLESEMKNRVFHWVVRGYIGLFAAAFVLFVLSLRIGIMFMDTLMLSFFLMGFYLLFVGRRQAKVYALVLLGYLLSLTTVPLVRMSVLPDTILTGNIAIFGAGLEALLFSILLSYRLLALKEQNFQTQREMMALKDHQNTILREKVGEQTRQLETLFQEMHHRVKNNLQFILTFLWLKKKRLKDYEAIQAFEATDARIHTIAKLHEILYKHNNLRIDFPDYIDQICVASAMEHPELTIVQKVEPMELDFESAVTIGLILNELLTNTVKYGMKGNDTPEATVRFAAMDENRYRFSYTDNGPGFDPEQLNKKEGLGFVLIQNLQGRLSGATNRFVTYGGLTYEIFFNKENSGQESA